MLTINIRPAMTTQAFGQLKTVLEPHNTIRLKAVQSRSSDQCTNKAQAERSSSAASVRAGLPFADKARVEWVDVAKGFCIIFVVMMHATLGVGEAMGSTGFMHWIVAFAQPFRMPDFFLIAGLFLCLTLDKDWRTFLDRKVLHFAYFYALWVTIQFVFKAPGFMAEYGATGTLQLYLVSFIEPFGTLWFIYILPIFFMVTRLTRFMPPALIFAGAALLEIAPIHTGYLLVDEFAARYVYFFAGYWLAGSIFKLADFFNTRKEIAFLALGLWALVNGNLVFHEWMGHNLASLPLLSLMLGFAGALAIIAVSVLLSSVRLGSILRYVGKNSIVIYLAFFLPMAVSRIVLIKTGLITDTGLVSLFVTVTAVVAPLIFYEGIKMLNWGTFLFHRPALFRLAFKDTVKSSASQKRHDNPASVPSSDLVLSESTS
jgi:uncharacterized membrane protein YcfT